MGLVVAYTWNREKQMFVALGKEFDMFLKKMYLKKTDNFQPCFILDEDPKDIMHKYRQNSL